MRRRIVTVVLLTAGLTGATSGASAGGYWGCAGTRHLDVGVCLQNPLPERLPTVPTPPEVPS